MSQPPQNQPPYSQPAYSQPPYAQQPQPGPPYSQPPQPEPQPKPTRGPKVLTFVGLGVLVVGITALVFAIVGIVALVPSGVIDGQGEPGSEAVLSIESSDPTALESPGDVSYALWEVTDSSAERVLRPSAVEVTGPDGEGVTVSNASVSSDSSRAGVHARTIAEFRASEPGTYLITILPSTGANVNDLERVIVTEAADLGGFIGGIFGTTGLMFLGIGGGMVGFALMVAGIIWWVMTSNRNKRIAGQTGPTQHGPTQQPGPTQPGPTHSGGPDQPPGSHPGGTPAPPLN